MTSIRNGVPEGGARERRLAELRGSRPLAFEPRRVEKPWGWELNLADTSSTSARSSGCARASRSASSSTTTREELVRPERQGDARAGRRGAGVLNTEVIGEGACFRYRPGTVHR